MPESQTYKPPKWKIHQTHPEKIDELMESLAEISDPELGLTILELGLVRDMELLEDHALVTMILTTPFCPYGPSMMEFTRRKVEAILGIPTKIVYGSETWDPTVMEEGLLDDNWGLSG